MASVKRLFRDVETELPNEVERELKNIADAILSDAVSRVPVDKGLLKASAFIEKSDGGWTIGFSAKYAPYQEFGSGSLTEVPSGYEEYAMEFYVDGSGRTPAQPFLFPAFLKERDKIVDKLAKGLNDYIKSK